MLAHRDAIAEDLRQEQNRAEKTTVTNTLERVQASINTSIAFLTNGLAKLQQAIDQYIHQHPELQHIWTLLQTISGVGCHRVADHMTALLATRHFQSAEQLAAYLGLVPVEWQSGSSVHGRAHLSKAGPVHLRQLLYLPAVAA